MPLDPSRNLFRRFGSGGAIALSFIVAFEILIMISPFALFFYVVFNPVLLALNQWSLTRWLTAFFLPHMIVPRDQFLIMVRVLGSVLFVGGMAAFLACAAQVYTGKIFSRGTATKGLYALVRHPQYTSLAMAALGLAILWPRFLTLVLFALMLSLYYILARDEERRMTGRFGESYIAYQNQTGMFIPRALERVVVPGGGSREKPSPFSVIAVFAFLCAVIVSGGFILRAYTVRSLPMLRVDGVEVICISPEDTSIAATLVPSVLADSAVLSRMRRQGSEPDRRVLAYFLPVDYVMQGMIANTGEEWKLFEQHNTIGMITEYIFHPFAHLTGGHAEHMAGMKHGAKMYAMASMKRRVIFVEIRGDGSPLSSPLDDFQINVQRQPLFFVDVHLHTAEVLQVRDTPAGSGWGTVPTPMF